MALQVRLVLVSPKYSGNVGACARVAANFNVQDFCVVSPQCDYLDQQAQLYGKGPARDILFNIKKFKNLKEAIGDCSAAMAFTRRHGDWSPVPVLLKDLASLVQKNTKDSLKKIALVFGREDDCLLREEQLLCRYYCSIPTSKIMPTMNLSHSVAVVLSRLYTDLEGQEDISDKIDEVEASLNDFEDMISHFRDTMVNVGMTKAGNPDRMLGRIKRILQKTSLRSRDIAVLRGFLGKVNVAITRIKKF